MRGGSRSCREMLCLLPPARARPLHGPAPVSLPSCASDGSVPVSVLSAADTQLQGVLLNYALLSSLASWVAAQTAVSAESLGKGTSLYSPSPSKPP